MSMFKKKKETPKAQQNPSELQASYDSLAKDLGTALNFFETDDSDGSFTPDEKAAAASQALENACQQKADVNTLLAIQTFWATWNLTEVSRIEMPSSLVGAQKSINQIHVQLKEYESNINRLIQAYEAYVDITASKGSREEQNLINLQETKEKLPLVISEVARLQTYLNSQQGLAAIASIAQEVKKPTTPEYKETNRGAQLPADLTTPYSKAITLQSALPIFSADEDEEGNPLPSAAASNAAVTLKGTYQNAAIEVASAQDGMVRSNAQHVRGFKENKDSFWPNLQTFWTAWNLTEVSGVEMPSSLAEAESQDSLRHCGEALEAEIATIHTLLTAYEKYVSGLPKGADVELQLEAIKQKENLATLKAQLEVMQREVASVINYPQNFFKASRVLEAVERTETDRTALIAMNMEAAAEQPKQKAAEKKDDDVAVEVAPPPPISPQQQRANELLAESRTKEEQGFQILRAQIAGKTPPKVSKRLLVPASIGTGVVSGGAAFLLTEDLLAEMILARLTDSSSLASGLILGFAIVIAAGVAITMGLIMRSEKTPKTKKALLRIAMALLTLTALAGMLFGPSGALALDFANLSFEALAPSAATLLTFGLTMIFLVGSYQKLGKGDVFPDLKEVVVSASATESQASAASTQNNDNTVSMTAAAASTVPTPSAPPASAVGVRGANDKDITARLTAAPAKVQAKVDGRVQQGLMDLKLGGISNPLNDEAVTQAGAEAPNVANGLRHLSWRYDLLADTKNVNTVQKAGRHAVDVAGSILALSSVKALTDGTRAALVTEEAIANAPQILNALRYIERADNPRDLTEADAVKVIQAGKEAMDEAEKIYPRPQAEEKVAGVNAAAEGEAAVASDAPAPASRADEAQQAVTFN